MSRYAENALLRELCWFVSRAGTSGAAGVESGLGCEAYHRELAVPGDCHGPEPKSGAHACCACAIGEALDEARLVTGPLSMTRPEMCGGAGRGLAPVRPARLTHLRIDKPKNV